jgi:hypothetical protein
VRTCEIGGCPHNSHDSLDEAERRDIRVSAARRFLSQTGTERARRARRAVLDAEERLQRLLVEDPGTQHTALPEPDWPGGVPSPEDLEAWAEELNWVAERGEAEAAADRAEAEEQLARDSELLDLIEDSPRNPDNYDSYWDFYRANPYARAETADTAETVPAGDVWRGELDAARTAAATPGAALEPVRLPWLSVQEGHQWERQDWRRPAAAHPEPPTDHSEPGAGRGHEATGGGDQQSADDRTAQKEYATYPGDLSFAEWRDLVYDPTWVRDTPRAADVDIATDTGPHRQR